MEVLSNIKTYYQRRASELDLFLKDLRSNLPHHYLFCLLSLLIFPKQLYNLNHLFLNLPLLYSSKLVGIHLQKLFAIQPFQITHIPMTT